MTILAYTPPQTQIDRSWRGQHNIIQAAFIRWEIDQDAGEDAQGKPIRYAAEIKSLPPDAEDAIIKAYHTGASDKYTPAFVALGALAYPINPMTMTPLTQEQVNVRPLGFRYLKKRGVISSPALGEQWQDRQGTPYTLVRWDSGAAVWQAADGSTRRHPLSIAVSSGWRPYTCQQDG